MEIEWNNEKGASKEEKKKKKQIYLKHLRQFLLIHFKLFSLLSSLSKSNTFLFGDLFSTFPLLSVFFIVEAKRCKQKWSVVITTLGKKIKLKLKKEKVISPHFGGYFSQLILKLSGRNNNNNKKSLQQGYNLNSWSDKSNRRRSQVDTVCHKLGEREDCYKSLTRFNSPQWNKAPIRQCFSHDSIILFLEIEWVHTFSSIWSKNNHCDWLFTISFFLLPFIIVS